MATLTYQAGWVKNDIENYWYSLNLSKVLRFAVQPQCFYRNFCDAKNATQSGLHKGNIFHWNVYSNMTGDDTDTDILTETDEIGSANFNIVQGSALIQEFGREVPYTGKLDDVSFHPIKEIIDKTLSNRAKKVFDRAAYAQFNATPLQVVPYLGNSTTAMTLTTNGTPAYTNNLPLGRTQVKLIRDIMFKRNIPYYERNSYACITSTDVLRPFKNDLEDIRKYSDMGFQQIRASEIGRYEEVIFHEQTNIPAEAWTNAQSSQAHFFGSDTVAEAIVVPEEIRGKIPTDYGRSKGVAYYALLGFGIVHAENDADNSHDARIVKWASAA